jgi:hypothetical protein
MIPAFERAKAVYAFDRPATVIGLYYLLPPNIFLSTSHNYSHCSSLKTEVTISTKTLVNVYQTTRHQIPEDINIQSRLISFLPTLGETEF